MDNHILISKSGYGVRHARTSPLWPRFAALIFGESKGSNWLHTLKILPKEVCKALAHLVTSLRLVFSRGKEKASAKQLRQLKVEKVNKSILSYPARLHKVAKRIECNITYKSSKMYFRR